MAKVAANAMKVPYSGIRKLAEEAMKMQGVVKLYFGESNLPTPDFIKEAASQALKEGYTYYSSNAGLPGLRQDLAGYYHRLHGVELDPWSEIVITASGVQALNLTIRCAIDPGDEAILLTPAWPNATSTVLMDSGIPHEIPLKLQSGRYQVDFEALEEAVTSRTRLLVYTSPSNPLGWVATDDEQQGLLDFARRHDLWILADEVYERIYYHGSELGHLRPQFSRRQLGMTA